MPCEPFGELLARDLATCYRQDDCLLLIDGSHYFSSVEDQQCLHRRMAHSLVPVDERMILNEEETQGRSSLCQGWIKLLSAEGLQRLKDG